MSDPLFDPKPTLKKTQRLPIHSDIDAKGRFPRWLHMPMLKGDNLFKTDAIIKEYQLNTVCEEAKCPNRLECFSKKTATFLLLGKECTRACGFCEIGFSKNPKPPEEDEPIRVALSAKHLGLNHVVLTMVARDDLDDGGASHVVKVIDAIRKENPKATVEVLTSDFAGNLNSVDLILQCNPEIFNYNIESVRRLSPSVRHKATYDRTLLILNHIHQNKKTLFIKSGLMLGLGESIDEVKQTLHDLKDAGVDIVTIGQYLQPSKRKLSVKKFITPDEFKEIEEYGYLIGIQHIYAGPFVRSSHNAKEVLKIIYQKTQPSGNITLHGYSPT